jgi:hypothetical protein
MPQAEHAVSVRVLMINSAGSRRNLRAKDRSCEHHLGAAPGSTVPDSAEVRKCSASSKALFGSVMTWLVDWAGSLQEASRQLVTKEKEVCGEVAIISCGGGNL